MPATRHLSVETELIHWILLILAAIAILLAIATALAADPMAASTALPADAGLEAGALSGDRIERPYFPESPPQSQQTAVETAGMLWMTMEHQRAGSMPEAFAGWEKIRLPIQTAVWREIGVAAAFLQSDELVQALKHLEAAEQLSPHHPVVAFLRGKVWLELASRPAEMTDEPAPGSQRGPVAPPTPMVRRAVYEVMAIADLQEAIEQADVVDPGEPLVAMPAVDRERASAPSVGDLITAIGEQDFVGQAHRLLHRLHLRRQEWSEAERQLDQATETSAALPDDHRNLAAALLEAGDRSGAVRVLGKDLQVHYPWILQGCRQLGKWIQGPEPWLW